MYAARRTDGTLTLLAINKSPSAALTASITLDGFAPASTFTVRSYGIPQDAAARTGVGSADVATSGASGAGKTFGFSFPPYSATVLVLTGTSALPPRRPMPHARAVMRCRRCTACR